VRGIVARGHVLRPQPTALDRIRRVVIRISRLDLTRAIDDELLNLVDARELGAPNAVRPAVQPLTDVPPLMTGFAF